MVNVVGVAAKPVVADGRVEDGFMVDGGAIELPCACGDDMNWAKPPGADKVFIGGRPASISGLRSWLAMKFLLRRRLLRKNQASSASRPTPATAPITAPAMAPPLTESSPPLFAGSALAEGM